MGIYQPTVRGEKTGVWWMRFRIAGRQIRESTGTTRKTVAVEAERVRRLELERALNGLATVENRAARIATVNEALTSYIEGYRMSHREKSIQWVEGRAAHVRRLVGEKLLSDITEEAVRRFARARLEEDASNRTVNMEIQTLSRVIAHARGNRATWAQLWPNVRRFEERSEIGRALSAEEEAAILEAAAGVRGLIGTFLRIALATGMRRGEILGLTWGQVDLEGSVLTVGRAKTVAGTGRRVPINSNLLEVLRMHREWYEKRMHPIQPGWFLFPLRAAPPYQPERVCNTLTNGWDTVRKLAKVQCRFHDLRHTAISRMCEAGVPDRIVMALAGHVSRAMLARYSHMSMKAMRDAVETLTPGNGGRVSKQIDQQAALEALPAVGMVV
ncbi:MAG: site-specific integrase [Acidobacteria bacterium]|nr:site-specific integrase [Acidobacteriota bacterium]